MRKKIKLIWSAQPKYPNPYRSFRLLRQNLSMGCPSNTWKFKNKIFALLLTNIIIDSFDRSSWIPQSPCIHEKLDKKGKHWPWNPSKATSNGTHIVLQIWAETVILKIMRILTTVYWYLIQWKIKYHYHLSFLIVYAGAKFNLVNSVSCFDFEYLL